MIDTLRNTIDYLIKTIVLAFALHITVAYVGIYLGVEKLDSLVLSTSPFITIYLALITMSPPFVRNVYKSVSTVSKQRKSNIINLMINITITLIYSVVMMLLTSLATLHSVLIVVNPYYDFVEKLSNKLPLTDVTTITIMMALVWVINLLVILFSDKYFRKEIITKKKRKSRN